MSADPRIYISHESALHFWRTNPMEYILDDASIYARTLVSCQTTAEQLDCLSISESEFGPEPIDVLVPEGTSKHLDALRYHVQKAKLPPRAFIPLRDGIYIASPAFCFVQLCATLPFPAAVELGMEICGRYALRPRELEGMASRSYQLEHVTSLRRKIQKWSNIHGLAQARRVSQFIADNSASPMETKLFLLLCLPQRYGGYNLPRPALNQRIQLPDERRAVLHQDVVIPDLLWESEKLVVEYDGGYHDDREQAARDARRTVELEAMGYMVETVKKQQVYDPVVFDDFATTIARRIGKRIRSLDLKQQLAREDLREQLLAANSDFDPVRARVDMLGIEDRNFLNGNPFM